MRAKSLRQKKVVIWLIVAGLVIVAGALYLAYSHNSKGKNTAGTFYPKASASVSPSNSTTPSSAAINSGAATPKPLPTSNGAVTSSSGAIVVTSPKSGATVTSGTTVTGSAQVFEGTVNFRLKGSKSGQLASGSIQVNGDSAQLSPFSFPLDFNNQVQGGSDTGVLEVFSISPKDGSEVNLVSIPVYIQG